MASTLRERPASRAIRCAPVRDASSLTRALAPLAALAAVWALTQLLPLGSPLLPGCPVLALTGCYCPGCGSTRAVWALAEADVFLAVRNNALLILMLPVLLGRLLVGLTPLVGWELRLLRVRPWMGWSALALILAFTLARNVSALAFLAPLSVS